MGHPVDVHVGKRLRLRRNMLGMSQEAMARAVGITFQQIQKYERGVNRMSASRLYEFSSVLRVPVHYFFEGLDGIESEGSETSSSLGESERAAFEHEDIAKRETLEMMRNYYRIAPPLRKRIADMVRAIADDRTLQDESAGQEDA